MELEIEGTVQCDVLVIGTEGTGARAALEAAERGVDVVAITKGAVGRSGATLTADGEIDVDSRSASMQFGVDGSMEDSPEQFARDMIVGGDYLGDQKLVAMHAREAPARISELLKWGAKNEGFIQAPGHQYPRGMWIPGRKLTRLMGRRMIKRGVRVIEKAMVLDLLRDEEGALGAVALQLSTGKLLKLQSRATVLATGGAMQVFPLATAPSELTGDGMAMALRAGATLQDMEFPMFLPYCFLEPPILRGVVFPYDVAVFLNTYALNRHGERYMQKWDPERMEKSTRDINAVAAAIEIREGRGSRSGGTYLSLRHLPRNLVEFSLEWFPSNVRGWRAAGAFRVLDYLGDMTEDAWEVAPACHFWNGGIKIDERCATGIPGLYAAGEGTAGIHGANRLAGNALTQAVVWGRIAGHYAAEFALKCKHREVRDDLMEPIQAKLRSFPGKSGAGPSVVEMRSEIRRISGDLVGIVREESSLREALEAIDSARPDLAEQRIQDEQLGFNRELVEALQNESMLDVLEAVARASLARQESRGAMFRLDFPLTDDTRWLCNILLRRSDGNWLMEERPVEEVYVPLPKGQHVYGRRIKAADE